jgi:hypothetical protein
VGEGPIMVGPFESAVLFLYTNTCRSITICTCNVILQLQIFISLEKI